MVSQIKINMLFNLGIKFIVLWEYDNRNVKKWGLILKNYLNSTSLDYNYVKPCFDLHQFKYNFLTLGLKDFLIQIVFV